MCGIPGSGKSVKAAKLAREWNAIIYSSDNIREKYFGNVNDQDHNAEVFGIMKQLTKNSLHNGENVIYDACNIHSKRRAAFLREIKNIKYTKRIIIMATPYEICLRNNWCRQRKVPDEVIKRMYTNWNTPAYWEGWDDIEIAYFDNLPTYSWLNTIHYSSYDQNNPHHKETLGEHMINTWNYFADSYDDNHSDRFKPIGIAALYHDIGKPFCEFKDEEGISHYYSHENVGAYDLLTARFFSNPNDNLMVSLLVNYHMRPFSWEHAANVSKCHEKYRKLWGEEFFNDIMKLHEADINSREG